ASYAQVTGPADAGRVRQEDRQSLPLQTPGSQAVPTAPAPVEIPAGAENVRFVLKQVRIVGATAFSSAELGDLYAPSIGKNVGLDFAYKLAGAITQRYRDQGYFLSRAFVPPHPLRDGVLTIKVVEGYVGKVDIEGEGADNHVVHGYVQRLLAQKPLKAEGIESILLRLNDLPGLSFRSVISSLESVGVDEGAVRLTLIPSRQAAQGMVSFDNFGSKFLGPYESQASLSASLLPLQQTTISGLLSLPSDELQYGTLAHSIVVAPDITLQMNAGVTHAMPGFTLTPLDVDSVSTFFSARLNYQLIRQRQENLSFFIGLDGRDTDTDSFGFTLTRDSVRALRAGLSFDRVDSLNGFNTANITISQGLDALGASKAGDPDLSRAEATPDFTKLEFTLSRLQPLNEVWSAFAAVSGQWASGPLFSSEEFGYGGQSFGRAFDASEITGDHGLAASFEVRYGEWSNLEPFGITPYAFYDVGIVWNDDVAQPVRQSGAAAGFGIRAATQNGLSGNIGLAWPIGRDPATPIYGGNDLPRLTLQISQQF
ncbi:MAG: ShlB/FhaC/HecB family hemolysin secretion/activation protein, partial [Pseudomonadota bacterium]